MVINNYLKSNSEVRQIIDEVMKKHGFRHHYQVAEYFGITAQTLSGWFKNNSIPHKHLLTIQNDLSSQNDGKNNEDNYSKKILQLFFNKGKIIIFFTLISTISSFIYFTFIASPIYTSNASVIPVGDNGSDLAGLTGAAAQMGLSLPVNNQSTIAWDELFFEILRSKSIQRKLLNEKFTINNSLNEMKLADLIINHLGLINKNFKEKNLKINKYLEKRIRISKTRFSPLINIEIDSFNPKLSSNMINRLISISNNMQVNIKTRQMRQKRVFIEERILEVEEDLIGAEGRLKSFQERNRRSNQSPTLILEESRLARDVTLQNNLYLTLKTQFEEAKIEEVERTPMVEIVDEPIPPIEKAGPPILVNMIIISVFTFIIFFIFYYLSQIIKPLSIK